MDFKMVAKSFFGAEDLLVDELRLIGASNILKGTRAVEFTGNLELMYKANLWCRTALRILKPVHSFPASSEQELYDEVKKIDWSAYLTIHQTLAIDAVVNYSNLSHTMYIAQKTKDAIVDQFREKVNERPSVSLDNPDLKINIHIYKNQATLSFDSSGESLHKRGYRDDTNEAPLNEALAAGLILLSGWDKKSNFVDFMCGSGTILIEAGLMAKNIPPGIFRESFAFEKWNDFDPDLWRRIITEAKLMEIEKCDFKMTGIERSVQTLNIAKQNVINAGLSDLIELHQIPFTVYTPSPGKGTVIINPPYGERLVEDNISELYKNIGDYLKKKFGGYQAWLLTSNREAAKSIGLHASKKIQLYNGALECRFLKFDLYEGSRKTKYAAKE